MKKQNEESTLENKFFKKVLSCPVCNESIKLKPEFTIDYFSKDVIKLNDIDEIPEIKLIRCKVCTHTFSSYILRPEILNNYYSNIGSVIYQNVTRNIDTHEKDRRNQARLIEKYLPSGGKVLDVGCGYGYLLSCLSKRSWERFGVEPSKPAGEVARSMGINILAHYVDEITSEQNKFDVILLMDVIEHLSDPQQMIGQLYNLLNEGGTLVIITGNIDSLNAKLAGSSWTYFNSYEHISFFNPKSLSFLLKKSQFKRIKIKKLSYEIGFIGNSFSFFKNLVRYVLFKKLKLRELKVSPLAFDHMMVLALK